MRNRNLRSQVDALQSLLGRTDEASGGDIELMGHWGRYLCVLTAGFLENALKEVYGDFVTRKANPQIAGFAMARLEQISNPKASRFVEVANSFDSAWATQLEEFLDGDGGQRRYAIDSIMANRHRIVHGKTATVSVGRVRGLLPGCIEVVEFLEDQVSN